MKLTGPPFIRALACVFLGAVLVFAPLGIRAAFPDAAPVPVSPRNLGVYKVPVAARDALSALHADVDHNRIDGGFVARLTAAQAVALQTKAPLVILNSLMMVALTSWILPGSKKMFSKKSLFQPERLSMPS